MNSKNSKISVVISTCNRPELLGKAIRSVLNQTFQNFEIIVVDDGLEKRVENVIKEINDSRIVYIQNKENLGVSASRNIGIKKASGDLISFLDDDDEFYPEKIEKQLEIMKKFGKQIDYTFCLADIYSQQAKKFIYTQKYNFQDGINNFSEEALALKLSMITPTIFCRRDKIIEIGGFDEKFCSAEDKDLFIRLAKDSQGFLFNKALVKVNLSEQDENHLSGNMNFRISGKKLLLKKYKDELEKRPQILSKHLFLLALLHQKNKDFKEANKLFLQSWRSNKKDFRILKQILKNLYLRFF